MSNFADQLFHAMGAISLQHAATLRPLTQSERSLLEACEAKAGPVLGEAERHVREIRKAQDELPKG